MYTPKKVAFSQFFHSIILSSCIEVSCLYQSQYFQNIVALTLSVACVHCSQTESFAFGFIKIPLIWIPHQVTQNIVSSSLFTYFMFMNVSTCVYLVPNYWRTFWIRECSYWYLCDLSSILVVLNDNCLLEHGGFAGFLTFSLFRTHLRNFFLMVHSDFFINLLCLTSESLKYHYTTSPSNLIQEGNQICVARPVLPKTCWQGIIIVFHQNLY